MKVFVRLSIWSGQRPGLRLQCALTRHAIFLGNFRERIALDHNVFRPGDLRRRSRRGRHDRRRRHRRIGRYHWRRIRIRDHRVRIRRRRSCVFVSTCSRLQPWMSMAIRPATPTTSTQSTASFDGERRLLCCSNREPLGTNGFELFIDLALVASFLRGGLISFAAKFSLGKFRGGLNSFCSLASG